MRGIQWFQWNWIHTKLVRLHSQNSKSLPLGYWSAFGKPAMRLRQVTVMPQSPPPGLWSASPASPASHRGVTLASKTCWNGHKSSNFFKLKILKIWVWHPLEHLQPLGQTALPKAGMRRNIAASHAMATGFWFFRLIDQNLHATYHTSAMLAELLMFLTWICWRGFVGFILRIPETLNEMSCLLPCFILRWKDVKSVSECLWPCAKSCLSFLSSCPSLWDSSWNKRSIPATLNCR